MKRKGFTLIELVVAIAILGVLMIMAIPSVKYIQTSNKDKKYEAYEKAITNSSKLYVDGYNEDLFGISNTGCAIIKYNDLKNRDLIEDIQLKNVNCNNANTCIKVKKSRNGGYHYETNMVCKENGKTVFEDINSSCSISDCTLEDGYGPSETLILTPNKTTYYLGDNPKASIKISDVGVGLKENQYLTYQWFKGSDALTSAKNVYFKNKNYESTVTRPIDVPNLENIDEPTDYYIKVTGNLYDIDNNRTSVNNSKNVKYFVGALLIQMKAGGATMATQHNANYKIDSSDYIYTGTNNKTISKIKYKGSADLFNYNNKDYINLTKTHYHIDKGKEWKRGSTEYNQDTKYKVTNFGYSDSDLIHENKTVEVVANWKIDKYTLTYDNNGGSGCTSVTKEYGQKWGTLCTPKRTLATFKGWTPSTVNANTIAVKNETLKATWKVTNLKPNKPTITNPTKGNWTNKSFGLGVKTTTDKKYLGYWYYAYDTSSPSVLNKPNSASSYGLASFTTANFSAERNQKVYVRVCSLSASSGKDANNCSDWANTPIKIDKTAPVMWTNDNKKGGGRKFKFKPGLNESSSSTKLTSASCKARASNNSKYSDDICKTWEYAYSCKYGKVYWWGWDHIDCKDAGGSGCKQEYWKWEHNSSSGSQECHKWCTNYNKKFFAGSDCPTKKDGWAYAVDNAGNKSDEYHWKLRVKFH